ISEHTGPHLRGTAITTNQDITCIGFPVCELCHNIIRVLRESLEAMVEERAIGIVSKYGMGQRGVKVGAMNLMIGSAKSLDIISSARDRRTHSQACGARQSAGAVPNFRDGAQLRDPRVPERQQSAATICPHRR